jgi:hypothetical protein
MNNFMKLLEEAETSNNNLKFKELLKRVYEISKSYNKVDGEFIRLDLIIDYSKYSPIIEVIFVGGRIENNKTLQKHFSSIMSIFNEYIDKYLTKTKIEKLTASDYVMNFYDIDLKNKENLNLFSAFRTNFKKRNNNLVKY